ncbi:MAG: MarR family transcriptional regulator [Thaumarchaeota archaeon]|nr:MarR family transcriptional regulator [Nitrososphaerota archaeon]
MEEHDAALKPLEMGASVEAFEEDYELSSREIEILKALGTEGESTVSFQGLKRKLGMHQETLSRALARLHRDGFVERTPDGYRLNRKAAPRLPLSEGGSERTLPVIRAYVPPFVDTKTLFTALRGSWFGSLRWLRYAETEGEAVLTWITEKGDVQVDLRVRDGSMTIQARVGESVDMRRALIAAHELYRHLASFYTKQLGSGVMLLSSESSEPRAS